MRWTSAIQIADALASAHAEGVIHCDVKPGNLLVDGDWRVRLVDFGIARVTSSTTGLTGEMLQGSAQYVAPEQVEGASVDGRTDLYALGTVLYEMLAGKTPFGGGTIASILARRLVNDPPSIRETDPAVPPKVDQVVLKALARDPDQRYQTVADLRDALMAIRQDLPVFVAPERPEQQRSLPDWPKLSLAGPALPWPRWETSRQALLAGTAQAADWTARTGQVGAPGGRHGAPGRDDPRPPPDADPPADPQIGRRARRSHRPAGRGDGREVRRRRRLGGIGARLGFGGDRRAAGRACHADARRGAHRGRAARRERGTRAARADIRSADGHAAGADAHRRAGRGRGSTGPAPIGAGPAATARPRPDRVTGPAPGRRARAGPASAVRRGRERMTRRGTT